MQSFRVADRGDAQEAGFSGTAQCLEGRNDFVAYLRDAEGFASTVQGNRVVQVENIDLIPLQALQAVVHGVADGFRDGSEVCRWNTDLGADGNTPWFESTQDASEIRF